jgi:hypothetical protein
MACKESGVQVPLAPPIIIGKELIVISKQPIFIFRYLISLSIIASSILILFFVSIPLFSIDVNELDKKKVIGMKPSVPMEFEEDAIFWWLVKEGNALEFHNSSDEKIKGNIVFVFEPNPCNSKENIEFKSDTSIRFLEVIPDKISKISFPVFIDYKSSTKINVEFTNKVSCFVNNGDSRNFGAKLISWSFE